MAVKGAILVGRLLRFRCGLTLGLVLFGGTVGIFHAPAAAFAETSDKPITRKGIEAELKIGGLKTSELVTIIKKRGVDFRITPDVEIELLREGAKPEVIDAARANFRGVETAAPQPTMTGTWAGSFKTCAQWQSTLTMRIVENAPDDITATVEIAVPNSQPAAFTARAILNPMNSFFAMQFTGWIHQPPGLAIGNIGGYVSYSNAKPVAFSGIIQAPGCGQIVLHKQ